MVYPVYKRSAALIYTILSTRKFSSTHAFSSSSTSLSSTMLTKRTPDQVQLEIKDPVDPTAHTQAKAILSELKPTTTTTANPSQKTTCSPTALINIAHRLGDIPPESNSYIASATKCKEAFDSLTEEERTSLLNIHARVKLFAEAQRKSVVDMEVDIPGGKAGQSVSPCRGTCCIILYIIVWNDSMECIVH